MSNVNESEQVLELAQTLSREFQIPSAALVSLEGIAVNLATAEVLTAIIPLGVFNGARQLTFVIAGGDAVWWHDRGIAGNDTGGNAQTETLTFTMPNETMTTANAYVASGLTATPATFTQGTADVTGTVSGNWVVQSSRKNATPRVWMNEFQPSRALTADEPIAEIKGSPSRIYQITGGNAGVEGWLDHVYTLTY